MHKMLLDDCCNYYEKIPDPDCDRAGAARLREAFPVSMQNA